MANETSAADQSRTITEPFHYDRQSYWKDLAPVRNPTRVSKLAHIDDKEMLAFMTLALEAFDLPEQMPVPPSGFPGHPCEPDDDAMFLIREGARYLHAFISGERKSLITIHRKFGEHLADVYPDLAARCAALEAEVLALRADSVRLADREVVAHCEGCGAWLLPDDDYASDMDSVTGCWATMTDLPSQHERPCYGLCCTTPNGSEPPFI